MTESASGEALTKGYAEFQTEARLLNPNYDTVTVTTDAWDGTQQAWLKLFPTGKLVLCFLHAVLKVQKVRPSYRHLRNKLKAQLWKAYKASNAVEFLGMITISLNLE